MPKLSKKIALQYLSRKANVNEDLLYLRDELYSSSPNYLKIYNMLLYGKVSAPFWDYAKIHIEDLPEKLILILKEKGELDFKSVHKLFRQFDRYKMFMSGEVFRIAWNKELHKVGESWGRTPRTPLDYIQTDLTSNGIKRLGFAASNSIPLRKVNFFEQDQGYLRTLFITIDEDAFTFELEAGITYSQTVNDPNKIDSYIRNEVSYFDNSYIKTFMKMKRLLKSFVSLPKSKKFDIEKLTF